MNLGKENEVTHAVAPCCKFALAKFCVLLMQIQCRCKVCNHYTWFVYYLSFVWRYMWIDWICLLVAFVVTKWGLYLRPGQTLPYLNWSLQAIYVMRTDCYGRSLQTWQHCFFLACFKWNCCCYLQMKVVWRNLDLSRCGRVQMEPLETSSTVILDAMSAS